MAHSAQQGRDAGPLRRPAVRAARETWARERRRITRWRLAFLGVLLGLVIANAVDRPYPAAINAWVLAGAASWVASIAAERDRARQVRRHDASALPSIGGWRLIARPDDLPSDEDWLALTLILWLYDTVRLERRPIRGHPRGGTRVTYADGGLRALARRWAAQSGAPVRQGDRSLARLRALGVTRGVRISQVVAHRLVFSRAEDAIRAMERATGRQLIAWELGRDPRAGDVCIEGAPEPARV
jgi:hypothetical protein